MLPAMPVERAHDHPTFELGEVRITSIAAPARGSDETALFRADIPAGAGLPPHRHDHFDVFTVTAGTATFHLGTTYTSSPRVTAPWCRPASSTGSKPARTASRSS